MAAVYLNIDQLLDLITPIDVREGCQRLYEENVELFCRVQGSTNNHQAWAGGYHDHVTEVLNIALVLWHSLSACRPLPFSLSDLLLVVFLHDIEKPWKYVARDGQLHYRSGMKTKDDHQRFRMQMLEAYGITLTPEQINGLEYVEGEIKNHSNEKRHMGPLAGVAHMCDVASARLWFDHPLKANDPWLGAERITKPRV